MTRKKDHNVQTARKTEVIKEGKKKDDHSVSEHKNCKNCSNPNCKC